MKSTTQPSLPILHCPKIEAPPRLTGSIDDPVWQKAAKIDLVEAVSGRPGRWATSVRVAWSECFLHVAFACQDDYVWGTILEHDGPIYDQECVEIFLNPSGCRHQYFEINLSPKNVVFDACILNHRTEERPEAPFIGLPAWEAEGLRTAVAVQGIADRPGLASGWSAEYALPFAALCGAAHQPPQPGDLWRINFYRIDSPRLGVQELYAWSPVLLGTFHRPWRFGYLRFDA
ncbi:MAG TPA: carbohydrate-binding family 9-like protein [bacterium]|nr:carbohydrate-binding family 9-like protein [bacterium]HQG44050.1 carbohydrate-binding family 9-like protein [bacterium]HQI48795.1 carbohydrate-binding family 9-like protein [bacterium]HQJ63558.1 carbohydrate-binding family 9-like protein [bacterium]